MTTCGCNCSPCTCPSSTGDGCVPDLCVPRACFFNGQLINADDLNVAAAYSRARDLMLGRFVGGWGVFGGLVVTGAPGVPAAYIGSGTPITPNPQMLAGTTIQVSPGVAIDARGRQLVLCGPAIIDLAALVAQTPTATESKTCADWFENGAVPIPGCGGENPPTIAAVSYALVAEFTETPARPAPQFSGGGACDPAPTCEFSRKLEGVKFSLVPTEAFPDGFEVTGCLETLEANIGDPPAGGLELLRWFDAVNAALASQCCSRPVVPLARVLLTADPGSLKPPTLPTASMYTIIDDAYPYRRPAISAALSTLFNTTKESDGPVAVGRVRVSPGPLAFTAVRGFTGVSAGGSGKYTLTLEKPLAPEERIVTVSCRGSNVDAFCISVDDESSAGTSVDLRFTPVGQNPEPQIIHVVVHRASGGK